MHVQERPNTHGVTRTNLIKGGETEGLSVFPCFCDFFFFFFFLAQHQYGDRQLLFILSGHSRLFSAALISFLCLRCFPSQNREECRARPEHFYFY